MNNFSTEKTKMQEQEETGGSDVFLLLVVSIAAWLLVFQSGLFI